MSSDSLWLPGVIALASASLWVIGCGGQAPHLASPAEIARVIDDNQHVIGPVSARKYVPSLWRKFSGIATRTVPP